MPLMFIARPQPCYNQIMKAILVDALDGIINSDGTLFQEMYELLEQYPNRKIIVTNANDQQFNQFNFRIAPYEVFTLKHNPDKVDPTYFRTLLDQYQLTPTDVIYFEHDEAACDSAQSLSIPTYHYQHEERDLAKLKVFLDENTG